MLRNFTLVSLKTHGKLIFRNKHKIFNIVDKKKCSCIRSLRFVSNSKLALFSKKAERLTIQNFSKCNEYL